MMTRTRNVVWALICAMMIVAAGCSGSDDPEAIVGSFESTYAFSTLSEAHSFGDLWAIVTVTDELIGERQGEAPDEGYAPRTVTLAVEDVLWAREGVPVGREIELDALGYSVKGGRQTPLVGESGDRFEVGATYLVALIREDDGRIELPAGDAFFPLVDGRIDAGDDHDSELRAAMAGLPAVDAVELVRAADPAVSERLTGAQERLDAYNGE